MNDDHGDWKATLKEEALFIARLVGLVTIGVALRRLITYLSGNSEIAKTILGGGLDDHINEAVKRDPFFRRGIEGDSEDEGK